MADTPTTTENKDTKPPIDPFLLELDKSFGKVIDPNLSESTETPKPEPVAAAGPVLSLSETLLRKEELASEQAKTDEAQAKTATEKPAATTEKPATESAAATSEAAAAKATTAAASANANANADADKKTVVKAPRPPLPTVAPVAGATTTRAEAPRQEQQQQQEQAKPQGEDNYITNLTEVQREEYELARFAERQFPELRGKADETLGYFRKLDKFLVEHPEADPNSEEFREFVENNKPKYRDTERRKVERAYIEDSATRKAKKEVEGELARIRQKTYELEMRPVIERTSQAFRKDMEGLSLPEGVDPLARDVAHAINENPEQALKQFPVEAPIVHSHMQAADEYIKIAHGVAGFDPKNPTHRWLNDFVVSQSNIFTQQPDSVKVRGGKSFLPVDQYAELLQKDPKAAGKHWTLSPDQVLDMIAINAGLLVDQEVKRLEAGGFKRERPAKTENQQPPKQEEKPRREETPSPKAGASAAPGAATTKGAVNPNAAFLESLLPGASKVV